MITCYDTASSSFQGGVPDDADAILFYVDGHFANQAAAKARFPHLFAAGRAVGLTVLGRNPVQGDDFEPGNWQGNVGLWVRAALSAGVWRPIIYADGSDFDNKVWPELESALGRPLAPPGPGRRFRTILADPDGVPSIPDRHDGKQYWWASIQGQSKTDHDISVLRDDFFRTTPAPAPSPIPVPDPLPDPPEGADMICAYVTGDRSVGLAVETKDGQVFHIEQQNPVGSGKNTDWWRKDDGSPNWLSLGNPGGPGA